MMQRRLFCWNEIHRKVGMSLKTYFSTIPRTDLQVMQAGGIHTFCIFPTCSLCVDSLVVLCFQSLPNASGTGVQRQIHGNLTTVNIIISTQHSLFQCHEQVWSQAAYYIGWRQYRYYGDSLLCSLSNCHQMQPELAVLVYSWLPATVRESEVPVHT